MPGGRPPKGAELVEGLEGSEGAKARLKAALETLTGAKTIGEACVELGVKEAMLHFLRTQALQGALEALEPKPIGRPRKERVEEGQNSEALKEENAELRQKARESEVKQQLMAALPSLRERMKGAEKKTEARQTKT